MKTRIENAFARGSDNVQLLWSTRNDRINALLKGSISVFEELFPRRIHGYYLVGSYVDGTAVATSDIDLHPVSKGDFLSPAEEVLVYEVRDICNGIPTADLNVDPWPEEFAQRVYAGLFRLVARPIYGADITDDGQKILCEPKLGVRGDPGGIGILKSYSVARWRHSASPCASNLCSPRSGRRMRQILGPGRERNR